MTPGPIQTAWLAYLRENADQQITGMLGVQSSDGSFRMCCLGALKKVSCDLQKVELPTTQIDNKMRIFDGSSTWTGSLTMTHKEFGLRESNGGFAKTAYLKGLTYSSLVSMNDGGMTWPQIADYIEENFDNVFTHSV